MVLAAEVNIHSIATPSIVIDVLPDDNLVICAANSAGRRLFPTENYESEGTVLTDFKGLDANTIAERKKSIVHITRCIEGKEPLFSEAQQQSPDGSFYWGRRAYVPILDANAEVKKVMVMSFDISELIESQQEMKTVINSIGAPIFIVDVQDGNRFFWRFFNPSAEKFYDLSSDELQGREIIDFEGVAEYRIAFRKRFLERSKSLVVAKKPLFFENEYDRPDGQRWSRTTYVPIFNPKGEVSQIMITSLDITELIETQNHLENALTKTLSEFVTICASCKNIKHNEQWQPIEQYASEQLDYHSFSHGMCKVCIEKLYSDVLPDS